jgi:hypothetical protein
LTPTHVDIDPPSMDSASSKTSGGGEQFISFLEKELIPYINDRYPTETYKMLIGHSFGGLLVMQTFVHHTNLFNSYVSIDPSMWWDKRKLLGEAKTALATKKFGGTSLFLGIANTMDDGMDINKVSDDTSIETNHIRSILQLKHYFDDNKQNDLKVKSKYYPDDSHGSVPLITEYDALHFLFDFYPLKISYKDYFTDTTSHLADKVEKHFSNVSKQIGYKVKPSESLVNNFAFQALGSKHFKKAERLFKMNVDNYPTSYNVYDSIGDYYDATGDVPKAISSYQKALTIKDNPDTRKKLEKLQGR